MWPTENPVDGYICEAINEAKGTASATLSKYFEKPVHLVYKGSLPRKIAPTTSFPDLDATAKYQDMYPMLVLSEESMAAVENELQSHIGTQGIDERWRTDKVPIERYVYLCSVVRQTRIGTDWHLIDFGVTGSGRI